MPFANTGLQRISYDEAGAGPLLILIAGLGAPRLIWWKQVGPFSRHYRVITPDNRGAGETQQATGSFTVKDMARDITGLIHHLGEGKATIAGISMGGFIALELALDNPGLVEKLILISTSPGGSGHVPAGPELDEILVRDPKEDTEKRIRRIFPLVTGPGYAAAHKDDTEIYARILLENEMADEPYERQVDAVIDYVKRGVSDRLNEIEVPTLIIHGEKDIVVPLENGKYLASHIKKSKLSIFPGVGHLPPIEDSHHFNREVVEFIG